MKTRTKITVTLAVGIGLLVGSMGVASASPHYTDWNGRYSVKAPVTSLEETKVTYTDSGRVTYYMDAGPVTYTDSGRVTYVDAGPVMSYELKNVQVTSLETDSKTDVRTNGSASNIWTDGSGTRAMYTNYIPFSF
ncbi:MAG: hypothetical protein VYB80_06555 [Actinomycetota bacterium]|nr:hypothetical protein [Actinomycetota bacterium]